MKSLIRVQNSNLTHLVASALLTLMMSPEVQAAADAYNLKIETSFVISQSCNGPKGTPQTSQITLLVTSDASTDPKVLSDAAANIKVCSPFTSPISQSMPTPFPVGLLTNAKSVALGHVTSFPLDATKFKTLFPDGSGPDTLQVNQIQSGVFEMKYIQTSKNIVKIGPIRAYLAQPNEVTVPGFIEGKQLPLQKVEVDVPAKSVTLVANLASVKTVSANVPTVTQVPAVTK